MLGDGSLALVVVGGLLGVGGTIAGVIGTAIRDQIQQRYDTKKRRAEKFEELVGAVYEFDHWIEAARDRYVYGRDVPETVSPFAKVQSISSIYFPQFRALVGELNSAVLQYRVWMLGAQGRRLNGLANINEGFNEAYEPYWRKCDSLLDALHEFAREHFQDEGPAEQKPPPPVTSTTTGALTGPKPREDQCYHTSKVGISVIPRYDSIWSGELLVEARTRQPVRTLGLYFSIPLLGGPPTCAEIWAALPATSNCPCPFNRCGG